MDSDNQAIETSEDTSVDTNPVTVETDSPTQTETTEVELGTKGDVEDIDLSALSLDEIKELRKKFETEGDGEDALLEEEKGEDLQGLEESDTISDEMVEKAEPSNGQPLPQRKPSPQLQQLVEATNFRIQGVEHQYNEKIATINHLQAQANELESDNPRKAAELDYQIRQLVEEAQGLQSDYKALQNYKTNVEIVPRYIPEEHMYTDEIMESFVEDGMSREKAANFVKNMFATETPTTIIALAKIGMQRKAFKNMLAQQQANGRRIAPTNKKPVRKDPDAVAELINRTKKIPKTLSPSASGVSSSESVDMDDLVELPLGEIRRRLKEELKRDGKV
jgi:hypothetical protein